MMTENYTLTALPPRIIKLLFSEQRKSYKVNDSVEVIEVLLFMLAYPQSSKTERFAKRKLSQFTKFLKSLNQKSKKNLINSGMPFTEMNVQFTHDFLQWLKSYNGCKVILANKPEELPDLNNLLYTTLTASERTETSAGLDNVSLLQTLGVNSADTLGFLLNEFNRLNHVPLVKDYLFDSLGLQCILQPVSNTFSLAYNQFLNHPVFYHDAFIKKFDHEKLIAASVPSPVKLNMEAMNQLIVAIKNAMALTNRETDTVTYMDVNTLRYVELERGISVAVYGMTPERQLPFESYMGYTLFKNGYPCAYGGSWIFGKRALFGINIFDWFRGGESGYVFCQLLRVYRQWFGVDYFEVEPYQYGQDNPDGIKSGAFWFYYRYGFRPVDIALKTLAKKEAEKIMKDKNYRSSEKTLLRFTESNIAWTIQPFTQMKIDVVTKRISAMIQKRYRGNRLKAEEESVSRFVKLSEVKNYDITPSLVEVAMWSNAFEITDSELINIFSQMSAAKTVNPYQYQQLLLKLFEVLDKKR
ncbi:MAG: hypothetical protein JSS90_06950 [Bacteroidetes bacterium]|jgi:hypothetical protein|nr:hypothetical protein [Bacteroidota bacterium]